MTVQTLTLPLRPIDPREVLRYAGVSPRAEIPPETREPFEAAMRQMKGTDSGRACFLTLPCTPDTEKGTVALGPILWHSRQLSRVLQNCDTAAIFCATAGMEVDRMIRRHQAISPTRALFLHAAGAERVEALCDAFEQYLLEKDPSRHLTMRFSPGYGDLKLEAQRDIFRLLNPEKHLGVSLTDTLLMVPSKSVTAVIGLYRTGPACVPSAPCDTCAQRDCLFRKEPAST